MEDFITNVDQDTADIISHHAIKDLLKTKILLKNMNKIKDARSINNMLIETAKRHGNDLESLKWFEDEISKDEISIMDHINIMWDGAKYNKSHKS